MNNKKNKILNIIFFVILGLIVLYFLWCNSYKLSKIYNKMFEINTKDSVYNVTDSTYNLIEIDSNLIDEDDAAQQSWKEYTPVSDTNK